MLKNMSIRACLSVMMARFGVMLLIGAVAGLLSLRTSNASLQQMYSPNYAPLHFDRPGSQRLPRKNTGAIVPCRAASPGPPYSIEPSGSVNPDNLCSISLAFNGLAAAKRACKRTVNEIGISACIAAAFPRPL